MSKSLAKFPLSKELSVPFDDGNCKPKKQPKSYDTLKSPLSGASKGLELLAAMGVTSTTKPCEQEASFKAAVRKINGQKDNTGKDTFVMWRTAILANHDKVKTIATPTGKVLGQTKMFRDRFCEFQDEAELPKFFDTIAARWKAACNWMTKHTRQFSYGDYPDMGWLLLHVNDIMRWYDSVKNDTVLVIKDEAPKKTLQTELCGVKVAPIVNKTEGNSEGYTYVGNIKYDSLGKLFPTYEDKWVELVKSGNTMELERLKKVLKKFAVNYEASETRVTNLLKTESTHD